MNLNMELPPRPPIPQKELAAIRRSVMEAVRRISISRSAEGRRENRLRNKRGYTKEHFEADALVDQMACAPRPPLNDPNVTTTVCAAAKRNDTRFFVRLGKALARKPKPQTTEIHLVIPPMQRQFLIGRWADGNDEYPALCQLTPEGLLAVLHHRFGSKNVGVDVAGIIKLRQRLGLRAFRRPKVHVVLIGNKLKYLD